MGVAFAILSLCMFFACNSFIPFSASNHLATKRANLILSSTALALAQLATHVIALQWIFAFVIMGLLFLASAVIATPGVFGQDRSVRQEGAVVSEDREREPLLDGQN